LISQPILGYKPNEYLSVIDNVFYFSPFPAKFDKITYPDWPFKEQNESADKIVDNTLQTKADANA